ncbi:glycosyltransferase family 2 protein [bacterium]
MDNYDLSIVIPCLDEEETIGICIQKIKDAFKREKINGEVIVVDNGCKDDSINISRKMGAKIAVELKKGYGNALRKGIDFAKGKYVIMADADNTYDFSTIDKFFKLLKKGNDLVMGSRFKGEILKGAMSWSHRYIGNPILSGMLKLFFGGRVSDAHCGLRGFSKEAYNKMNLKSQGMEFASEMVIHALKENLKITEISIKYYPRKGESKLNSVRDAWRHVRFMLVYSPKHLFLIPGFLMFLIGTLICSHIFFAPLYLFGRGWDIHVMVLSGMVAILGWQVFTMGIIAKAYVNKINLEKDQLIQKFLNKFNLEFFLILGFFVFCIGLLLVGRIFWVWYLKDFGVLDQIKTGIIATLFITIGAQTLFSSFLVGVIKIDYK